MVGKKYSNFYILLVFIFVYLVLFEFIIPGNRFLPRPTILFDSFISLWSDYNLLKGLAVTAAAIYIGLIAGYLLIAITAEYLIRLLIEVPGLFNGLRIFKYFPAFIYAILFVFWFPDSVTGEIVFSLITSAFLTSLKINKELPAVKKEYLDAAISLGFDKKKIYKKVIWKQIEPEVFDFLSHVHYAVWGMILVFEFINRSAGLGSIYYRIYVYDDFGALFSLAVLISLLIFSGETVHKFIKKKMIHWES